MMQRGRERESECTPPATAGRSDLPRALANNSIEFRFHATRRPIVTYIAAITRGVEAEISGKIRK